MHPARGAVDERPRWSGRDVEREPDALGPAHPQQPSAGHRLGQADADAVHGDRSFGPRRGDALEAGHAGDRGDPAVVVDDQAGAVQTREQRRGDPAQRLEPDLVLPPEARLGQLHRGGDQRDGRGMDGLGGPAHVDHAQQLTGPRVVHRARGARPHVVGADEMLRGEDLDRGVLGERGADRVGADHALGPVRALGEAQRVGATAYPAGTLPPEQHAVGVGDDHDVTGVLGDRGQRRAQLGKHPGERRAGPDAARPRRRRPGRAGRRGRGRPPGPAPAARTGRRGGGDRPGDGRRRAARCARAPASGRAGRGRPLAGSRRRPRPLPALRSPRPPG